MIFLVSSGKMIFVFPESMILSFRHKMKDSLSKKITLEYNLFYIMRKDGISFSQKYDTFFTDGKWKMIFFKKYMEI